MSSKDMLLLQKDYSEGVGNHGENLMLFTRQLNRYRQMYYNWAKIQKKQDYAQQHMTEDMVQNSNLEKFNKYRKRAKILFALSLLLSLIHAGSFLWLIFGILVVVMLMSLEKTLNTQWILVYPIITFVLSFSDGLVSNLYGTHIIFLLLFPINILLFAAYFITVKKAIGNTVLHSDAIKITYDEINDDSQSLGQSLNQLRLELSLMWPKVQEEYYSLYPNSPYKLPSELWWECPQDLMDQLEKKLKKEFSGDYFTTSETRAIVKTAKDAFAITRYEMAPLYDTASPNASVSAYYENLRIVQSNPGGIILDFITSFVHSREGSKQSSYEVNLHSGLERFGHTAYWLAVGGEIDDAYQNNRISKGDYDYLLLKYENAVHDDHVEMNKTQTVNYTEVVEIKENTTLWTGQALLLPDPHNKNSYILLDYRCQPSFMFENINALSSKYSITGVLGDYENRNPFFLAKVHQNYVQCE